MRKYKLEGTHLTFNQKKSDKGLMVRSSKEGKKSYKAI